MAFHDLGPKFEFDLRRTRGDEAADKAVAEFRGAEHPAVTADPETKGKALFAAPEVEARHRRIESAINSVSVRNRGYFGFR